LILQYAVNIKNYSLDFCLHISLPSIIWLPNG
jgi:hypothetical protein